MKETGEQIEELIDEMSYDLAECHVEFLLNGELYTDYSTMAQKMVSRGYRRQNEVAREILEGIEEFILTCIENDEKVSNSGGDEYYDGRFMAFKIIEEHLAELKKKYTEV